MGRHPPMQSVELDEPDAPDAPPLGSLTARDRWRRVRRWIPALAAVAVVLAGMQAVDDARERAAIAELAAVPGVVHPVGADVRVLWTPEPGTEGVLTGIPVGDTLVGLARPADGSQSLVALDEQTGERRWTTPLADARPVEPAEGNRADVGGCLPVPEVADRVLCLVSDSFYAYGDQSVQLVPGELSRLVVLTTDDGAVLADHPVPPAVGYAALPGLAVVAVPREGGIELIASDLETGRQRWATTMPIEPSTADDDGFVDDRSSLVATADGLAVVTAGRMTLLDRDGVVVREGVGAGGGYVVDPTTRTLAVMPGTSGNSTTTFLERGSDLILGGRPVRVSVDDGSLPGLVLLSDSAVSAYDRGSSAPRWSVPYQSAGDALVIRGRVYLSTTTGVTAVDGRTGRQVWEATVPQDQHVSALVTDGVHLLSPQWRPDAAAVAAQDDWPGVGELVAYRFEDGGVDWRADLPDILGVWSIGATLVGWGLEDPAVLG